MESILFYTFSTIAATFGSAVGIIVAAAIFRMQRIDLIASELAAKLVEFHEGRHGNVAQLKRILSFKIGTSFWRSGKWNQKQSNAQMKMTMNIFLERFQPS